MLHNIYTEKAVVLKRSFIVVGSFSRNKAHITDQTGKIIFKILLFGLQRENTISIFHVKCAKVVP